MITPIEIALNTPLQIGDWTVDPRSDRLWRANEEVRLEPKVMSVLICLAQQPGQVVSRETLEASVWAGTVVGYDAISASIIKLRRALKDNARHPRYIETVSKKGYRLIADVTKDIKPDSAAPENRLAAQADAALPRAGSTPSGKSVFSARRYWLVAGLPGLVALLYFSGYEITGTSEQEAATAIENLAPVAAEALPSIVVLPLHNLSGDPKQDYFSEGITDDIITDLSKVGSLRIIARQSAYYYKDRPFTLEEVARDLNVRYIVEGSVQKAGERLRINIQLTNVPERRHVWAERFDTRVANVFDIQDKITQRLIEAMVVTLSDQDHNRLIRHSSVNYAAYDAFLYGQQQYKNRDRESYDLTIDAYQRAIKLDPDFARAYGALAVIHTIGDLNRWNKLSLPESRELSLQLAKKAVVLDRNSPEAYWSLGFVHLFRKEFAEAEAAVLQSIRLSPNFADGYGLLAFIANWRGKAGAAIQYINRASALNPHYTFDYPLNLGMAFYTLGQYARAEEELRKALDRNATSLYARLFLAASYVQLGRRDDGEWEVQQAIVQVPETTLSQLAQVLPYESRTFTDRLLADLSKAGLPR